MFDIQYVLLFSPSPSGLQADDPINVLTYYEAIGNMQFHNEIASYGGKFALLAKPAVGSSETESKYFVYNRG